jgi:hypothetical protein
MDLEWGPLSLVSTIEELVYLSFYKYFPLITVASQNKIFTYYSLPLEQFSYEICAERILNTGCVLLGL